MSLIHNKKNVFQRLIAAVLFLTVFLLGSCDISVPTPSRVSLSLDLGSTTTTGSVAQTRNLGAQLESITVNIKSADLGEISYSLPLDERSLSIEVPAGPSRTIEVIATTKANADTFIKELRGQTTLDLYSGEQARAAISMAVSETRMVVIDEGNARIAHFSDMTGSNWSEWTIGDLPGADYPIDTAFGPDGRLYIAAVNVSGQGLVYRISQPSAIAELIYTHVSGSIQRLEIDPTNRYAYFTRDTGGTGIHVYRVELGTSSPIHLMDAALSSVSINSRSYSGFIGGAYTNNSSNFAIDADQNVYFFASYDEGQTTAKALLKLNFENLAQSGALPVNSQARFGTAYQATLDFNPAVQSYAHGWLNDGTPESYENFDLKITKDRLFVLGSVTSQGGQHFSRLIEFTLNTLEYQSDFGYTNGTLDLTKLSTSRGFVTSISQGFYIFEYFFNSPSWQGRIIYTDASPGSNVESFGQWGSGVGKFIFQAL